MKLGCAILSRRSWRARRPQHGTSFDASFWRRIFDDVDDPGQLGSRPHQRSEIGNVSIEDKVGAAPSASSQSNGPDSRSDAHVDPLHFLLTAAAVRLHRDCDPTAIAASSVTNKFEKDLFHLGNTSVVDKYQRRIRSTDLSGRMLVVSAQALSRVLTENRFEKAVIDHPALRSGFRSTYSAGPHCWRRRRRSDPAAR
jgi:hypothetical protein